MTTRIKMSSCLRRKVCALCDQELVKAARGQCGSIFERDGCWWVPTIRDYGVAEALRMSKNNQLDHAKDGAVR